MYHPLSPAILTRPTDLLGLYLLVGQHLPGLYLLGLYLLDLYLPGSTTLEARAWSRALHLVRARARVRARIRVRVRVRVRVRGTVRVRSAQHRCDVRGGV